jgi:ribosome maturation factor RimP
MGVGLGPPFFVAETGRSGMSDEGRIARLIEPTLEDMGFELVRVRLSGTRDLTLQVMADRADGTQITVDDCAEISQALSALLDVEDPIDRAYSLEVSSPGIDRPLTRLKDFERYAGFEAKIELARLLDGRRRYRGTLEGVEGETVRLRTDRGEAVELPFAEIGQAKLVLTDALIEASRAAAAGTDGTVEGSAL